MFNKLKETIQVYRETVVEVRKKEKEKSRAEMLHKKLFNAAAAYNEFHCWAGHKYTPLKPTWMCPECNTIHEHSTEERDMNSWFLCGPIYPACCSFKIGHRMWDQCAAKSTENKDLWNAVRESKLNKKWSCLLSKVDPFKPLSDSIDEWNVKHGKLNNDKKN
jgi:hypothetical protein